MLYEVITDHVVGPGNIRLFQANTFLWAGLALPFAPEARALDAAAHRLAASLAGDLAGPGEVVFDSSYNFV